MSASFAELKRPFKHQNYRLMFSAQIIALLGMWMQQIAIAWLVYRISGSALLLGTITFLAQIPNLFFAPFGGILADRYPKRNLLRCTASANILASAILAILVFSGYIEIWHLFILAVFSGTVMSVDAPTRQAFVVDLVGREDLKSAIAMNSSVYNAARLVGPTIAGALIPLVGEAWLFALTSVAFFAPLICISVMKLENKTKPIEKRGVFKPLYEGFQYLIANHMSLFLLLMLGLFNVMHASYNVLFPVIAVEVLGGNSSTMGILVGSVGAGAMIGALFIASYSGSYKSLIRMILISATVAASGVVIFPYSNGLLMSCSILVVIGFAFACQMATTNTVIQLQTADEYRGRVMSFYNMMFMGLTPIGSIASGYIADQFGPAITITCFGVFGFIILFCFAPVIIKGAKAKPGN